MVRERTYDKVLDFSPKADIDNLNNPVCELRRCNEGSAFKRLQRPSARLPSTAFACSNRRMNEHLLKAVDDRIDDLVALTRS